MVPESTQIDLRIDPESTSRLTRQTGPEMPSDTLISRPQISHTQNRALFRVLLTIAELYYLPSKDWIRAPT